MKFLRRIADRIIARAMRDPYFHIVGTDGSTYMERYWLLRPRKWLPISIRVHHILRSDDDRALHDHPFAYCSIILRGGYAEVRTIRPGRRSAYSYRVEWHGSGAILLRSAVSAHRIEIRPDTSAWTLFIMGPRTRTWGFHAPYGWVPWDEYLAPEEVEQARAEHDKLGVREVA